MSDDKPTIDVPESGPFLVKGLKKLTDAQDQPIEMAKDVIALCRCGASKNKPFCDGAHKNIDWDPTETAEHGKTAHRRIEYDGDTFAITDDKALCWHAGFCVREYGHVWNLTETANSEQDKQQVKEMVHACPSSRLQYHEPKGFPPIEPELSQRIAVIDDGPLYLQGGIPVVGADGAAYETLNRVSLCRCGASANKPYCDGRHSEIGFEDSA